MSNPMGAISTYVRTMSRQQHLITTCTLLINIAVYFREFLASGLDSVSGDLGDARLSSIILEHWFHVYTFSATDWRSPNFFWPVQGVLGYNDALFFYSIPFAIFRAMGLDRYLAFALALITLKLIGWITFFLLARRFLRVDFVFALIGASIFFQLNSFYSSAIHVPLGSVVFIPSLFLVAIRACHDFSRSTWQQYVSIAILIGLYSLLMLTSYDVGWFLGLIVAYVALIYGLTTVLQRGISETIRGLVELIRNRYLFFLYVVVIAATTFIPFMMTYLPVQRSFKGYRFSEVLNYMPSLIDVINVGPNNLLWSGAVQSALGQLSLRSAPHEFSRGYTLTLFGTFMVVYVFNVFSFMKCITARSDSRAVHKFSSSCATSRKVTVVGTAMIVLWIFVTKRYDQSLWGIIYAHIPGARYVQCPGRIQIVFAAFVVGIVLIGMQQVTEALAHAKRSKIVTSFPIFIALICLLEQYNIIQTAHISRRQEYSVTVQQKTHPKKCEHFFLVRAADDTRSGVVSNIDAMIVAQDQHINTLNGYSKIFPKGWLLFDTQHPDYLIHVEKWIKRMKINGPYCVLDMQQKIWKIN